MPQSMFLKFSWHRGIGTYMNFGLTTRMNFRSKAKGGCHDL